MITTSGLADNSTAENRDERRSSPIRLARYGLLPAFLCLPSLPGCAAWKGWSDQSKFRPIVDLQAADECVVRLYAAPIPSIEWLAVHTWLVVKPKGSTSFERWEVWQVADLEMDEPDGQRFGHVYRNLQGPESECSGGPSYILAEATEATAEPIVAFIRSRSPQYALRHRYSYYPGPNSNTYTAWALKRSGWKVALPPAVIGKDWFPLSKDGPAD